MFSVGKWLLVVGFGLVVVGGLMLLLGKTGIPFGHLPGDISVGKGNTTFSFPIVTCLVVSVILTVIINILLRIMR